MGSSTASSIPLPPLPLATEAPAKIFKIYYTVSITSQLGFLLLSFIFAKAL